MKTLINLIRLVTSFSLALATMPAIAGNVEGGHVANSWYSGKYLDYVAFPIGGMGAGMVCLDGTGSWSNLSVTNQPDVFNEPFVFAALHVRGAENGTKVLQGQVPGWKIFGRPGTANGGGDYHYGLPRFERCRFLGRFPFGYVELEDPDIPLTVSLTGWSPFIPGDADNSSLPAGSMEYTFKNPTDRTVSATFSWNAKNFIRTDGDNLIVPVRNGFLLRQKGSKEKPQNERAFAMFTDEPAGVDCSWFRGGWFDALTILWKDISSNTLSTDTVAAHNSPGATLFIPFEVPARGQKTIRLMFCWYSGETRISSGVQPSPAGPAFSGGPAPGTAPGQQDVTGYSGKRLVNTYYPDGDGLTGTLTSPEFKIRKRYLAFLAGGGGMEGKTCVTLMVGGKTVLAATGRNEEKLAPVLWDLAAYKGKKAVIRIVDDATGPWGHINADQFVFSDDALVNPSELRPADILFADFEGEQYSEWTATGPDDGCAGCDPDACTVEQYYKPWYAGRFGGIGEVIAYWTDHYDSLKEGSQLFANAFWSSSLPPEVMEATGANLSILKSPTVLRDTQGRIWAWEGCSDQSGCCAGSCTHVWNYAQALPHLFPELERSLRMTEFTVSQNSEGHQTFRANLPIYEPQHGFHAASDGQLGGIIKVYRDWRISGDSDWLSNIYPFVKKSLDYCIRTWDPDRKGVLSEPHHNTYDIEFWGPDGMCTSFYLGALTAFIEMSDYLNKPSGSYRDLLKTGKAAMEADLFNGEYFIQKIRWTGLHAENPAARIPEGRPSSEAEALLLKEGPKYQYGSGCLSDGILGMWMASTAGLPEAIDSVKVKSHLSAVHTYNFREDLRDHDNPQRPTYALGNEAGLLLCTWPKGGKLSLPFVYSNEVWTGIEYQVAGHLMMHGEVQKGLDIVRACRNRYNGTIRNPFDEYECGHWYARALSSYGMLQALTGIRYDAVERILYMDSRIGTDFTSFLSTETGFGNAGMRNGEPFVEVKMGKIPFDRIVVR